MIRAKSARLMEEAVEVGVRRIPRLLNKMDMDHGLTFDGEGGDYALDRIVDAIMLEIYERFDFDPEWDQRDGRPVNGRYPRPDAGLTDEDFVRLRTMRRDEAKDKEVL